MKTLDKLTIKELLTLDGAIKSGSVMIGDQFFDFIEENKRALEKFTYTIREGATGARFLIIKRGDNGANETK